MGHKCNSPIEKFFHFLFKKRSIGLVLLGFGFGAIVVIFLPIRVWLILLAVASIAYGIYCLKDICD